jgi:hypothetical protein
MLAKLHTLILVATLSLHSPQSTSKEHESALAMQKLRTAKTVYFDDQTRTRSKAGDNARAELKKWNRYKIVDDRTQADLILLFSLHKYEGGYEVHQGGPTGATSTHGQSQEGLAPSYVQTEPAQAGFLTAIDPKTGDALWSYSHQWGGLLTGFDSVGVRLVDRFKKAVK